MHVHAYLFCVCVCVLGGGEGISVATHGTTAASSISGWPVSIASNSAGATCIMPSFQLSKLNEVLTIDSSIRTSSTQIYLITIVLDQLLYPIHYVNVPFIIKVTKITCFEPSI